MNEQEIMIITNAIFKNIFGESCPYSLEELYEKFAFDIKLPKKVYDSTTNEPTWADSINSHNYITLSNMEKRDIETGWLLKRQPVSTLEDIIAIWETINYTTTERVYDSLNVSESDTIYNCQNIHRSSDCSASKNLIFCDSCGNSEYLIASQRSGTCSFCIRTDDSKDCSNSYNVICSNKISNSFFIQDCFDLYECMFCSHIANKKYCIANMQFTESEYFIIKKNIIKWILNS